jgi:hypothetical protein
VTPTTTARASSKRLRSNEVKMPGWWNKKKENDLNKELRVQLDMVSTP